MNKEIAVKTLELALKNGADAARIILQEGTSSSISVLDGELDKLQRSSGASLGISIFVDGRFGTFSTNRMKITELDCFISQCIASVRLLAPDLCRTLPYRALCYDGKGIDLKRYDESFETVSTEKKKEFLFSIASETDRSDKRIISVNNEYEDTLEEEYLIDSNGFEVQDRQTSFAVSSECSVDGGDGSKPQNWWYDGSLFFDTLPHGCGKKSLDRTLRMIDGKKIRSGKYSAVLENTVSNKVVSPIISALSGASIQQRNSFLLDAIGKKVFPEILTLSDEPHIIGAFGSRYYDMEGLATIPADIIKDGVICQYFLSTYFANKLKMKPTIDSPSAPCFRSNSCIGLEDILKQTDRGIFVTGFNGGNCNGATGDFSYGVEGFFFENGKISHPIKEMNMTGNIISLWNNILLIGNDPRQCFRWQIPSLAFGNVDFSGC